MFHLFIELFSFSSPLAKKCLFLNDEPCMVRSSLIGLNPFEFKYYPFMIRLNEYAGSYNVLSPKICVPEGVKHINVKAFNMITNKN